MAINYKQIIDSLDEKKIINLMLKLGADRYEEKEKMIIFPTICHNHLSSEASMKLYYYKDTKLFVCYTEDGTMNIFKFLETYYKSRDIIYDWYHDILNVIQGCSTNNNPSLGNFEKNLYESIADKYIKKDKSKPLEIFSPKVLDIFEHYYPIEWLNDGITKEAMDKFNILYYISQNKIIIPHYNINNELIGIRGRALNPYEVENFGKYCPIQIEKKWYSHPLSLNLYGLNINKQNIIDTGICYVFESEKSVLQFESFNRKNCAVAVCGSNFNKFQLKLLIKTCYPKEIVICFDNEEKTGEDKYFQKLFNICKKYNLYTKFSFIYDRTNLTEPKDSPSDKGEVIFEKLLRKRVQVK